MGPLAFFSKISSIARSSFKDSIFSPFGIVAFIVKEINGVLHFLTQLKLESGVMDLLEISPTVQCITSNYEENAMPSYVDQVTHRENVMTIADVYQSEEGGRFYNYQNK